MIKNKRGDIPVTILVIGVILVCGLVLLSFSYSKYIDKRNFLGTGLIEELNSKAEIISFYEDSGILSGKIDDLTGMKREEINNKIYTYIDIGEKNPESSGGVYVKFYFHE